ncbi:hypothetical protein OUZ56_011899 [Daphnia magna]|uniref:Uncharacterized protein n=1 Tax=Daphnia magna TaxID=35525 RepID=A0ABQ9Z1F8_9CRUS|nr:hypothetical protein OUZ56_011899 [Daphnia magna]
MSNYGHLDGCDLFGRRRGWNDEVGKKRRVECRQSSQLSRTPVISGHMTTVMKPDWLPYLTRTSLWPMETRGADLSAITWSKDDEVRSGPVRPMAKRKSRPPTVTSAPGSEDSFILPFSLETDSNTAQPFSLTAPFGGSQA